MPVDFLLKNWWIFIVAFIMLGYVSNNQQKYKKYLNYFGIYYQRSISKITFTEFLKTCAIFWLFIFVVIKDVVLVPIIFIFRKFFRKIRRTSGDTRRNLNPEVRDKR